MPRVQNACGALLYARAICAKCAAASSQTNKELKMESKNVWMELDNKQLNDLEALSSRYINFISQNKTERECVTAAINMAENLGYKSLDSIIESGAVLSAGSKVWAATHKKALILFHVGSAPLTDGFNILGAHLDSPRLDIKQNPLYETTDMVLLDTHYYGGIKKYQWTALPLALHGVVCKKDGSSVQVVVGEDATDPVFCITDILPHLGAAQMKKEAAKIIEGEDLDLLIGSRPLVSAKGQGAGEIAAGAEDAAEASSAEAASGDAQVEVASSAAATRANTEAAASKKKEHVRAYILKLLKDKYGIEEADFLSAELEVVPAGAARNLGFDESMVLGYGQDDKVCAYTSLEAQLAQNAPKRSSVCVLVDKEEIGSVGASGMESLFFENTVTEVMRVAGYSDALDVRRALKRSRMLSSDVSAGFDPLYSSEFEKKNSAYLGHGLVFNKYTGARGKSGSNDASAEYMAKIRDIMGRANVVFQTAELGRVDAGGGGTIAFIPARYDMDVIDSGVAVLSMHAPWEVTSKADIYMARLGYDAFLQSEE